MRISDQVKALLAELGTTKCKKGKTWRGYTVYIPAYSGDPCIGLPYVILEKNDETRICNDEECFEYLDYSLGEEDD